MSTIPVPHGHVAPPYEDEEEAKERLWRAWKAAAAAQHYPGGSDQHTGSETRQVLPTLFPSPSRILFLGCGDGTEVDIAWDLGHDAWGVTLNRNNLDYAVSVLDLHSVYLMDMHFLPLDWTDCFDGVMGMQVMEHSPAPAVVMLPEVLRVLKSGGLAYFETPHPIKYTMGTNPHHFTCPTQAQAEGWMLKSGFVAVRVDVLNDEPDAARHLGIRGRKP